MSFYARYHGRCACCEEHVKPGDLVAYEDDALVCESCMTSVVVDDRSPCPTCWLVGPCDCEG